MTKLTFALKRPGIFTHVFVPLHQWQSMHVHQKHLNKSVSACTRYFLFSHCKEPIVEGIPSFPSTPSPRLLIFHNSGWNQQHFRVNGAANICCDIWTKIVSFLFYLFMSTFAIKMDHTLITLPYNLCCRTSCCCRDWTKLYFFLQNKCITFQFCI